MKQISSSGDGGDDDMEADDDDGSGAEVIDDDDNVTQSIPFHIEENDWSDFKEWTDEFTMDISSVEHTESTTSAEVPRTSPFVQVIGGMSPRRRKNQENRKVFRCANTYTPV